MAHRNSWFTMIYRFCVVFLVSCHSFVTVSNMGDTPGVARVPNHLPLKKSGAWDLWTFCWDLFILNDDQLQSCMEEYIFRNISRIAINIMKNVHKQYPTMETSLKNFTHRKSAKVKLCWQLRFWGYEMKHTGPEMSTAPSRFIWPFIGFICVYFGLCDLYLYLVHRDSNSTYTLW